MQQSSQGLLRGYYIRISGFTLYLKIETEMVGNQKITTKYNLN